MFVLIPDIVDQDHSLEVKAQKLCGYIISLSSAHLGCIAKNKYFAARLNCSISSVQRYLRALESKGYIEVKSVSRAHIGKAPERVIVPTSKILVNFNISKSTINKRDSNKKPDIQTPDWFEDYMKNR